MMPKEKPMVERGTITKSFMPRRAKPANTPIATVRGGLKASLASRTNHVAGVIAALASSIALTTDKALAAAGVAAAIGSVTFAGYMIVARDDGPAGIGRARPLMLGPEPLDTPSPRARMARASKGLELIDFNATGSITRMSPRVVAETGIGIPPESGRKAASEPPPESEQPRGEDAPNDIALDGYVLRFVDHGAALVQGKGGIYAVVPGATLPEAGSILSIEQRAGRWIVVCEKGVIEAPRL